jgi:MYXO-CTERM domain-containing protein
MMRPLSFHGVLAEVSRVVGWLVVLLLLPAPFAFAGDGELDTFILTGPDSFTTSTTADFTFDSNLTTRPVEFWCALDAEDSEPCNSRTWHREGITPGPHRFFVYAYDRARGRVDNSPAEWPWTVEETPLDAGSPGGDAGSGNDGGSTGSDAGSDVDGGSSGSDAGSTVDGGSSGSDAGSDIDGGSSGGDAGSSEDGGSTGSDAGTSGNDGGSPASDAGSTDGGGSPGNDAGTAGNDGGSSGDADGGTSPDDDGGTPGEDGGSTDPVPPGDTPSSDALDYLDSGMGCTGAPAPGAMTGLVLLALALRRRRRR